MNISDYGYDSPDTLRRHMYEFATGVAGGVQEDNLRVQRNAICIAFDVSIKAVTYGYAGQLTRDFNKDLLMNFAALMDMSENEVRTVRRAQRPYCQCAEAHAVAKMTQEIRRQSVFTNRGSGRMPNIRDTGLCPPEWSNGAEIWNAWEVLSHTVIMAIRAPSKEPNAPQPTLKNPCENCLDWIQGNVGGYFNATEQLIITGPTG